MRFTRIITLACMAFLLACNAVEQPMSIKEKAQLKASVTETYEAYLDVTETVSYDDFASYNLFNEDYSIIMDGVISVGGEKAEEMFKGSFSYIKEFVYMNMMEQEVIVLDRNSAIILASFDEEYVTVSDDTLKVQGAGTYVLELVDEEWKIVHINAIHKVGE